MKAPSIGENKDQTPYTHSSNCSGLIPTTAKYVNTQESKNDKGRNCNLCHNVHGATNQHLIENKAWFGNWEMPINYKAFENGGSCAPGCHEEKKYIRYELPDSLKIGN